MEFGAPRRRHRMSLTPMIDVVFLLLVFFMLASRFGLPMQLPLTLAGGASEPYRGPARLVLVTAEGQQLNGTALEPAGLLDRLTDLTEGKEDMIVLRAGEGVELQRLMDVMGWLGQAGYDNLVLVE